MAPAKDTLLSSPDPLGLSNGSISSHSPKKKGRQPLITPRKALAEASGNSQVQEFYINTPPNPAHNASPRKSPRQPTRSSSPWRIRLTVQAEPVDEIQSLERSPGKRLTERTTTITVPLKGGDDTPPAAQKKGRGRPRKSLEGPVFRSGTPKPKAGGRRKTIDASPKKQEVDPYRDTASPSKKPRGRPKKSMGPDDLKSISDMLEKNDLDVWLESSLVGGEEKAERSKTPRTRSRGRRQEITPRKIAVDSDVESQSNPADVDQNLPKELAWRLGNRHDERNQIGQRLSQPYEAPVPHIEQSSLSGLSREQSVLGGQDDNGWRSMISHNTRSPSLHRDDAQDQTEFDPTGPYQEYDSLLESEGFSMVSVSSLPSVGHNSVSPPQQCGSPHNHTPNITSSPSDAPAPEPTKVQSSPRQLKIASDGTPKLAKVVRAGIALQGALSTKDRSQKLGSPFQEPQKASPLTAENSASQREIPCRVAKSKSPDERSDDPFHGFGAGTRRELKAGLRLGEELAKRQQQNQKSAVVGPIEADDVFQRTSSCTYPQLPGSDTKEGYSLELSGSKNKVRYPLLSNNQLPSPERSLVDEEEDRMSWRADTPIKQEKIPFTSAQILVGEESAGIDASAIDHTMIARKEEWQRERDAVSKQIEMANKSQVIIIDSDDEEEKQVPGEDVADGDIWKAEAQSVNRSDEVTPEPDFLLQPELVKPRRSKIPSPWRRSSQVIYSDKMESTESDLFWQPDQSQARASKRRNARNDQIQYFSDIPAKSRLDDSLGNTRKAEAQIQVEASKGWPIEDSVVSNDEETESAIFAEHDLPEGSIQHSDQATKSPVVVTPSENRVVPELCATPKETSIKNVIEVSEKIATLQVTEGTSAEPVLSTSEDSKVVIDPRLFQKKTRSSSASKIPVRPVPIQPLQLQESSTSWLSRLTAPIWSVFAPAASLPPAATKEDILCSSPHEPLCQLTPWEECHFRALGPLYYGSLLYGAHLFPFNPNSPSARYCGAYVTTKLGWSRKITPEDCGITDAFMVLLDERGFALGEPRARWIDEGIVITMCVALWVGMVKRGEIEVDGSKGERVGLRDQSDRKWTKDDIDWAGNQSAYFERKRREFDGLPSWKNKGLI